ncbi:hypothetical protein MD484_g6465, partial [Candolleomyces efflorescens]
MAVDAPVIVETAAELDSEDWVDDDGKVGENEGFGGAFVDAEMEDIAYTGAASVTSKRLVPDEAGKELYERWKALVPSLAPPLLKYLDSTVGKEWARSPASLISECSRGTDCPITTTTVTALFFAKGFLQYTVQACLCESACHVLVRNGLFPTAPTNPRQAVSLELLDLFLALTERSSDAVTAMATALNTTYRNRGFVAMNSKGKRIKEPFRKGLGYALQWYDCARVEIERLKDQAVASKFMELFNIPSGADSKDTPAPASRSLTMEDLGVEECHRILQLRCAACFGGKNFGRLFKDGADIHVAVDANFNHRHLRSAGTSAEFYSPHFFIPKEDVDAVGERIEKQRPRKKPRQIQVPKEAIDSCQEAHTAGTGSTVKTSLEKFDIGGLAALVCRHDIPLFIANVDTPGEQQKYAVSLIEHMFLFLPRKATVVALYDIGCVVDRSVAQYELFAPGIAERIRFSTSVMHSYVHEWSCQLYYNPRFQDGLGLTDGENVERLWSRTRGLIPVCRTSGKHRRVWLIDRKLRMIAKELKEELGSWISRRLKKGTAAQGHEAQQILDECKIDEAVLEAQWADQKSAQTSLRSLAPKRLKTHLGNILNIHTDINELESTIEKSLKLVSKGSLPETCRPAISNLQTQLQKIEANAQSLYAAINIPDEFPSLRGVDMEFIRKLYLIREVKSSVQRKATSAFWEFDKLDRATGGKDIALGTKMHQHVRSAMTKKTASLATAIKRYNAECQALAAIAKAEWNIPLPEPLPTSMAELKKCTTLMENDVRDGIRAMLRLKRCTEEKRRLSWEANNMLRWYLRELQAITAAMQDPIIPQLQLELEEVLALKESWGTPLVTEASYDIHSRSMLERVQGSQLTWVPVAITDDSADGGGSEPSNLTDAEGAVSSTEAAAIYGEPLAAPSAEEVCLGDLFAEQEDRDSADTPVPLVYKCILTWKQPVRPYSVPFLLCLTQPIRTT